MPYLGGVAVFLAVACRRRVRTSVALLVPLALALALGVADDVGDLPPRLRLAGEVAVGVAAAAVVRGRGPIAAVVTVAFVAGAASTRSTCSTASTGLPPRWQPPAPPASPSCSAARGGWSRSRSPARLAGFLVWNRPPARIYLGDAGQLPDRHRTRVAAVGRVRRAGDAVSTGRCAAVRRGAGRRHGGRDRAPRRGPAGRCSTATAATCTTSSSTGGGIPRTSTILCIAAQVLLTVIGLGLTALPAGLAIGLGAVVVIGVGGAALRVFTAPGRVVLRRVA